jgi:hypothetical protein
MAGVLDIHFQEDAMVTYLFARAGLAALAALTILVLALTVLPVAP